MGNFLLFASPHITGPMRRLIIAGFAVGVLSASTPFDETVQPVLKQTCMLCHNEKLSSGGLNITPFLDAGSLGSNREGWERILAKLRTGEMPPKGVPHPPAAKLDALINLLRAILIAPIGHAHRIPAGSRQGG